MAGWEEQDRKEGMGCGYGGKGETTDNMGASQERGLGGKEMVSEGGDMVRKENICQSPVDKDIALWKGSSGLEKACFMFMMEHRK